MGLDRTLPTSAVAGSVSVVALLWLALHLRLLSGDTSHGASTSDEH